LRWSKEVEFIVVREQEALSSVPTISLLSDRELFIYLLIAFFAAEQRREFPQW
jgi:hypothetical protein